jgi:hypothetical protein
VSSADIVEKLVPFVFCSGQQKSRAGPVSPDAAPQAAATASPVPAALLARAAGWHEVIPTIAHVLNRPPADSTGRRSI